MKKNTRLMIILILPVYHYHDDHLHDHDNRHHDHDDDHYLHLADHAPPCSVNTLIGAPPHLPPPTKDKYKSFTKMKYKSR